MICFINQDFQLTFSIHTLYHQQNIQTIKSRNTMSEEGDEVQHKASCHTPAEWNLQRANFTQLYFVEDRPLSQVQKLMEERHGFYAT